MNIAMTETELLEQLDKLPAKNKENFIFSTIQSNPNFYRFKNRLANLYINNDQILKARVFLEKELTNKYNVHLQITLVKLELKCDRLEAAREAIMTLQKNNPKSPHTYSVLGNLHAMEGKESEAIEAFNKAHELNPNIVKPVIELHDLYIKTGDLEHAKATIYSGLKHKPNSHIYQSCLGKIWQKLGEDKKAIIAFDLAIKLAPNDTQAGNAAIQLVNLKINRSSEKEVLHQLYQFIAIYPQHIGIRINLIRFLTNNKSYNEALAEIEKLKEIAPEEIRAEISKVVIYQKQN
jgi:tetratricopeptide (TPR) repeat protein